MPGPRWQLPSCDKGGSEREDYCDVTHSHTTEPQADDIHDSDAHTYAPRSHKRQNVVLRLSKCRAAHSDIDVACRLMDLLTRVIITV